MRLDGRTISKDNPPYIIAEISANHNGNLSRALETILAAKNAGAHAVKIQTYTPDTMTLDIQREDFLIKEGLWKGRSLYDLYSEAYTPYEWHEELFEYARKIGLTIFSSPFDETAVDLLVHLNTPAFKIASFELTDLPLIEYVAKQNKPMLMSTGMASIQEIGEALEVAKTNGCSEIALFHCISSYPASVEDSNLRSIQLLEKEFDVLVGLSDHTIGNLASIVATSLGASVIEKHFTLTRSDGGVDSAFSLEPSELKSLVLDTRQAFESLGNRDFIRPNTEKENKIFRRSLYFVEDLEKGVTIEPQHIRRIRPGYGLEPKHLNDVIGKITMAPVSKGDRVSPDSFAQTAPETQ